MKRILFTTVLMYITLYTFAQPYRVGVCEQGNHNPTIIDKFKQWLADIGIIPVLPSFDPNEIIGPEGYDSMRWVSVNDVLNYTIRFENDSLLASAAAQKVDVRFDFPNKNLMKGFGISNYLFSNMSFKVDKPSNAYQNRIDLKDTLGIYVSLNDRASGRSTPSIPKQVMHLGNQKKVCYLLTTQPMWVRAL